MVDLKDRYMAAAAEHGRCTESGNYKKGNAAFDRMKAALAGLRGSGDRVSRFSWDCSITQTVDEAGRATDLLHLRPDLASPILENLASGRWSQLEFVAKMFLREWRGGRLKGQ